MEDNQATSRTKQTAVQFIKKPIKTVIHALTKLCDDPGFKKAEVNSTTASAIFEFKDALGEVSVVVEPASQGCNVKVAGDSDEATSRLLQKLVKTVEKDTHPMNVLFIIAVALVALIAIGWGIGAKIHDNNEQKKIEEHYSCTLNGYSDEYCDSKYGN
ncbi:MAG: hypothetical protein LKK45_09235 [Bifidobacterium psychraerophilum]|jgi:hypothetical protein|uniref:hypothetical protein n=1 Tax=Bifidobacterium psychraerophilum TaxID=218140 RepID=UPI0023F76171|nr:hypothetical protein [Bifidobacterium psychraerophilum]MCI1660911.1 hypothetical protein [Bifidobacterium psychraerophilum]MCI2177346.1 hypothetical protein [Bifidobacterium psychraerophilum]MCI2182913.1 hypothetical protein [Bifidobacterium psychraerophilum]